MKNPEVIFRATLIPPACFYESLSIVERKLKEGQSKMQRGQLQAKSKPTAAIVLSTLPSPIPLQHPDFL